MGNEKHNKTSVGVPVRPPPSRMARPRAIEKKGETEGDYGGRQMRGRGMDKVDWRRLRRWPDDREEVT